MRTPITDAAQTSIAAFSLFVMVFGLLIKYRVGIRQWVIGCWITNPHITEPSRLEAVSVDSLELAESQVQAGEHSSLLEHEGEGSSFPNPNDEDTTAVSDPGDDTAGGSVRDRTLGIARWCAKSLDGGIGQVRGWFRS
ncbi:hypothetical protein K440DRAFT_642529 [Wilcoxina mikolae CBS 423.85]|nr:hypothetical protein K440DRAFT_642529 [Wilcoxina mikolae CBS 423.85]